MNSVIRLALSPLSLDWSTDLSASKLIYKDEHSVERADTVDVVMFSVVHIDLNNNNHIDINNTK